MSLNRLDTATRVGDMAFEALQTAISNGDYAAGDRLQIRDVAAQLGISVMPVREAIKRLEEIGLVETRPYKGAVVKEFTPDELLNIYAVRRLLETDAARQGVDAMTPEDITDLEELFTSMSEALADGDVLRYLDLDEEILMTVYSASDNPVLMEMIQALWARCRHFKILGARRSVADSTTVDLLRHQRELIDAARRHDGAGAAATTMTSLDEARARIRASIGTTGQQ
ncbi:MAG: GntR family transcriptional regulator [Corynebacterium nuruki]|jgi:DNA-binding GntR family transcriptional regulator|nr:GntR family transcriptional regulator [Corynebacterium nuruki]